MAWQCGLVEVGEGTEGERLGGGFEGSPGTGIDGMPRRGWKKRVRGVLFGGTSTGCQNGVERNGGTQGKRPLCSTMNRASAV